MPAREWLDRKVYPLVSLQVMISVEALRTLIAFERTFIMRCLRWCTIHLLHLGRMATVEPRDYPGHATIWHADHGHLTVRVVHIGHDRTTHGG